MEKFNKKTAKVLDSNFPRFSTVLSVVYKVTDVSLDAYFEYVSINEWTADVAMPEATCSKKMLRITRKETKQNKG